jgi:hypothetical protein
VKGARLTLIISRGIPASSDQVLLVYVLLEDQLGPLLVIGTDLLVEKLVGKHETDDKGPNLCSRCHTTQGRKVLSQPPDIQQRDQDDTVRDLCDLEEVGDELGERCSDIDARGIERFNVGHGVDRGMSAGGRSW